MRVAVDPASVAICAELPGGMTGGARAAWLRRDGRPRCPVTWAGDPEAIAAAGPPPAEDEIALAIDPAWLASRRTLRERIADARRSLPSLGSAVLRGPRPLEHHALLAEEGIRVVLVEVFGVGPRGSRRPAPRGWDCRNPVWGLWEVRATPQSGRGLWGWLSGPLSRPRPGSLRILEIGSVTIGPRGPTSTRLARFGAWVERREAGKGVRPVRLSDLASTLAGGPDAAVTGSILKAA